MVRLDAERLGHNEWGERKACNHGLSGPKGVETGASHLVTIQPCRWCASPAVVEKEEMDASATGAQFMKKR